MKRIISRPKTKINLLLELVKCAACTYKHRSFSGTYVCDATGLPIEGRYFNYDYPCAVKGILRSQVVVS